MFDKCGMLTRTVQNGWWIIFTAIPYLKMEWYIKNQLWYGMIANSTGSGHLRKKMKMFQQDHRAAVPCVSATGPDTGCGRGKNSWHHKSFCQRFPFQWEKSKSYDKFHTDCVKFSIEMSVKYLLCPTFLGATQEAVRMEVHRARWEPTDRGTGNTVIMNTRCYRDWHNILCGTCSTSCLWHL